MESKVLDLSSESYFINQNLKLLTIRGGHNKIIIKSHIDKLSIIGINNVIYGLDANCLINNIFIKGDYNEINLNRNCINAIKDFKGNENQVIFSDVPDDIKYAETINVNENLLNISENNNKQNILNISENNNRQNNIVIPTKIITIHNLRQENNRNTANNNQYEDLNFYIYPDQVLFHNSNMNTIPGLNTNEYIIMNQNSKRYLIPATNQNSNKNIIPSTNQNPIKYIIPTTNPNQIRYIIPAVNQNPIKYEIPTTNPNQIRYIIPAVNQNPIRYVNQANPVHNQNVNSRINNSNQNINSNVPQNSVYNSNVLFNNKNLSDFDKKKDSLFLEMDQFQYKHIQKYDSRRETECAICLEEFKRNDIIKEFYKCKHIFHKDCLKNWLKRANVCPLCKHDLTEDINTK